MTITVRPLEIPESTDNTPAAPAVTPYAGAILRQAVGTDPAGLFFTSVDVRQVTTPNLKQVETLVDPRGW